MDSRPARSRSSSSSRSRSPISNHDARSISTSPRRGPSTPVKSTARRANNNDDHPAPDERNPPTEDRASKATSNEPASPILSDTEQSHQKKRSHHGHHHHRHHKESKSTKRSSSSHRQSTKRSKKESTGATRQNQSDDENSVRSVGRNTSESEQSPTKRGASPSDNESNEEEGVIEGNSTPSDHRSSRRQHRKRRHSSSPNNDRNSASPHSPSGNIPKTNKGTQLIVNYLPESLNEADFYQLFARVAPVKLCKLITDRYTGHSYCYGFIEYHSKDDAAKAIKKYNGYGIEHKKLKVSYAQPKSKPNHNDGAGGGGGGGDTHKHSSSSSAPKNPNIYITELPDSFDEKMLKRLFSKYGEIVQAKILRDPRTRISRGVGFVLMTSTRYAERAIKALDGYVPSGAQRPISVKYADPKKSAAAATAAGHGGSMSRLSNAAPMSAMVGPYGYPPGFPSLGMIDPYYAAAALHHQHRTAMNMREMSPSPPPSHGSSYYGSSRHGRSSRMRSSSPGPSRSYSASSSSKHNSSNSAGPPGNSASLAAAYELISKGCQQAIDPNGFVIYAFGLPRDCVEHELEELFRRYGDVYRVYIVKNYTTGESKGYSFITMRNYDEACHAIDSLHNSTFQGRTIQVRFKQ